MKRSVAVCVAVLLAAVLALTCRGCSASAWSQRGTIGVGFLVPGGGAVVITADNTHGVWCAYWSDARRGLPDIAITAEGTQVSPDGRKVQFYSAELSQ